MSSEPASAPTTTVAYGKRAAQRPPSRSAADWPYPTCVRFCATPHETGGPCRSFGDEVFLALHRVDADTGAPSFVLVFPDQPEAPTVVLTASQASVLAAELSPDNLR